MSNIEEKLKELEPAQIVIYSIVALLFIFIFYGVLSSGSEKAAAAEEVTELEMPDNRVKVAAYESKLEAYKRSNDRVSNNVSLEFNTNTLDSEEKLTDQETREALGLESDNEKLLDELLEQDRENEKKQALAIQSTAKKEKELSYAEKLAIAREKHFVIREVKEEEEEREKVVFRGYVFRTQYVVPGERVDLMTSEEFVYNNTRFKKGMRFYAMVDIKESRILFDIDNIAHKPLKTEVRDIADGRIGLYSKQAGELWAIYQERLKEETRNNVTREISNEVRTPIVSSTIQVLSNFFASKKGRKSKKLKIDNNSQFIVTLL